jgi:hypothetical protein
VASILRSDIGRFALQRAPHRMQFSREFHPSSLSVRGKGLVAATWHSEEARSRLF